MLRAAQGWHNAQRRGARSLGRMAQSGWDMANRISDPDMRSRDMGAAQVSAIQAVAAALDRLADSVENLHS
jgi:hypothetical protein